MYALACRIAVKRFTAFRQRFPLGWGIPHHAQEHIMNHRYPQLAQPFKLALKKETLRQLTPGELKLAAGGWIRPPLSWSCPDPARSEACTVSE
jgi:hypothetical protein